MWQTLKKKLAGWFKRGTEEERLAAQLPDPASYIDSAIAWAGLALQGTIAAGDAAAAVEPEHLLPIAQRMWLRDAAHVAEVLVSRSGKGSTKLAALRLAARAGWAALAKADELFDAWWERSARPFVADYVAQLNARRAW